MGDPIKDYYDNLVKRNAINPATTSFEAYKAKLSSPDSRKQFHQVLWDKGVASTDYATWSVDAGFGSTNPRQEVKKKGQSPTASSSLSEPSGQPTEIVPTNETQFDENGNPIVSALTVTDSYTASGAKPVVMKEEEIQAYNKYLTSPERSSNIKKEKLKAVRAAQTDFTALDPNAYVPMGSAVPFSEVQKAPGQLSAQELAYQEDRAKTGGLVGIFSRGDDQYTLQGYKTKAGRIGAFVTDARDLYEATSQDLEAKYGVDGLKKYANIATQYEALIKEAEANRGTDKGTRIAARAANLYTQLATFQKDPLVQEAAKYAEAYQRGVTEFKSLQQSDATRWAREYQQEIDVRQAQYEKEARDNPRFAYIADAAGYGIRAVGKMAGGLAQLPSLTQKAIVGDEERDAFDVAYDVADAFVNDVTAYTSVTSKRSRPSLTTTFDFQSGGKRYEADLDKNGNVMAVYDEAGYDVAGKPEFANVVEVAKTAKAKATPRDQWNTQGVIGSTMSTIADMAIEIAGTKGIGELANAAKVQSAAGIGRAVRPISTVAKNDIGMIATGMGLQAPDLYNEGITIYGDTPEGRKKAAQFAVVTSGAVSTATARLGLESRLTTGEDALTSALFRKSSDATRVAAATATLTPAQAAKVYMAEWTKNMAAEMGEEMIVEPLVEEMGRNMFGAPTGIDSREMAQTAVVTFVTTAVMGTPATPGQARNRINELRVQGLDMLMQNPTSVMQTLMDIDARGAITLPGDNQRTEAERKIAHQQFIDRQSKRVERMATQMEAYPELVGEERSEVISLLDERMSVQEAKEAASAMGNKVVEEQLDQKLAAYDVAISEIAYGKESTADAEAEINGTDEQGRPIRTDRLERPEETQGISPRTPQTSGPTTSPKLIKTGSGAIATNVPEDARGALIAQGATPQPNGTWMIPARLVPTAEQILGTKVGAKDYDAVTETGIETATEAAAEVPKEVVSFSPFRDMNIQPRREGNVVVYVSPDKVLAAHAKENPKWAITNKENQIGNRVEKAKQYLSDFLTDRRPIDPKTGERIEGEEMPFEASMAMRLPSGKGYQLHFEDGRHRILAAKEMGIREVPIEVPASQAAQFEELYGDHATEMKGKEVVKRKATERQNIAEAIRHHSFEKEAFSAHFQKDELKRYLRFMWSRKSGNARPENSEQIDVYAQRLKDEWGSSMTEYEIESAIINFIRYPFMMDQKINEILSTVDPSMNEEFERARSVAEDDVEYQAQLIAYTEGIDIEGAKIIVEENRAFLFAEQAELDELFSNLTDNDMAIVDELRTVLIEATNSEPEAAEVLLNLAQGRDIDGVRFYFGTDPDPIGQQQLAAFDRLSSDIQNRIESLSSQLSTSAHEYFRSNTALLDPQNIPTKGRRTQEVQPESGTTDTDGATLEGDEGGTPADVAGEVVGTSSEDVSAGTSGTDAGNGDAGERERSIAAFGGTDEEVASIEPAEAKQGRGEADIAQAANVAVTNWIDLYRVGRRLFGLSRPKAIAAALVMDRMIGNMARRKGVSKSDIYATLNFADRKQFDKDLATPTLFQERMGANEGNTPANYKQTLEGYRTKLAEKKKEVRQELAKANKEANEFSKGIIEKLQSTLFEIEKRIQVIDRELANTNGRKVGADWLKSRIYWGVSEQRLSERGAELAIYLINQNKELFQDVALSFKSRNADFWGISAAGQFDHIERLVTIFNPHMSDEVLMHELVHSLELYLPENDLRAIRVAHFAAIQKEKKKHKEGSNEYKYLEAAERDDRETADKMLTTMQSTKLYHLHNWHEYWVHSVLNETITKAEGTFLQNVARKSKNLIKSILAFFGIESDIFVINAYNRLIKNGPALKSYTPLSFDNSFSLNEEAMYQMASEADGAQAAVRIAKDGKAVIYALTSPNVSSPLHELAHVFEHYLTDTERQTVLSAAGHTTWSRDTSEFFARGFERYLAEGVAPSSILKSIFQAFKQWLTDIYGGIKGSPIDVKLTKETKALYASMLASETPAEVYGDSIGEGQVNAAASQRAKAEAKATKDMTPLQVQATAMEGDFFVEKGVAPSLTDFYNSVEGAMPTEAPMTEAEYLETMAGRFMSIMAKLRPDLMAQEQIQPKQLVAQSLAPTGESELPRLFADFIKQSQLWGQALGLQNYLSVGIEQAYDTVMPAPRLAADTTRQTAFDEQFDTFEKQVEKLKEKEVVTANDLATALAASLPEKVFVRDVMRIMQAPIDGLSKKERRYFFQLAEKLSSVLPDIAPKMDAEAAKVAFNAAHYMAFKNPETVEVKSEEDAGQDPAVIAGALTAKEDATKEMEAAETQLTEQTGNWREAAQRDFPAPEGSTEEETVLFQARATNRLATMMRANSVVRGAKSFAQTVADFGFDRITRSIFNAYFKADYMSLGLGDPVIYEQISLLGLVRKALQDSRLPIKRMQEVLADQGFAITEEMDVYQGKELEAGKVGAKIEQLEEWLFGKRKGDISRMVGNDTGGWRARVSEVIAYDDMATFMYALHAPSRNARVSDIVAKRNQNRIAVLTDSISEMTAEKAGLVAAGKLAPSATMQNRIDSANELLFKMQFAQANQSTYDALMRELERHEQNETTTMSYEDVLLGIQRMLQLGEGYVPYMGSGMSDTRANAIIDQYKSETMPDGSTKYDKLVELADEFRQKVIIEPIRDMQEAQMITETQATHLIDGTSEESDTVMEHYLPLMVTEDAYEGAEIGMQNEFTSSQIYRLKGTDKFTAKDRYDPVAMSVSRYIAMTKAAERNRSHLRFLTLLESIGATEKSPTRRWRVFKSKALLKTNAYGEITDTARLPGVGPKDPATNAAIADNSITVRRVVDKVNEEGETKQKVEALYLFVAPTSDGYTSPVIAALKSKKANDDGRLTRIILDTFRAFNNYLRLFTTSASWSFAAANTVRDMADAISNSGEIKARVGVKALRRNIIRNYWSSIRALGSEMYGTPNMSDMYNYWLEAQEHGVKMSWLNYDGKEAQIEQFQDLMRGKRDRVKVSVPIKKVEQSSMFQNAMGVATALSDLSENATRLAVFASLRQEGVSPDQAAQIAKNITVNFEKKGDWGGVLNALFLFMNAGVQSSARTAQSLKRKEGWYTMGIWTGLGFAMAAMSNAIYGDDDDDYINDKVLSSNNVVVGPFKVPLPYSLYSAAYMAGTEIHQTTVSNSHSSLDAVTNITERVLGVLDPIGGSGGSLTAITPTAVRPFFQVGFNEDWAGREIVVGEQFYKDKLDFQKTNKGTSEEAEIVAKWLYDGLHVDVAPPNLEYLYEQYFGKATAVPTSLYKGIKSLVDEDKTDDKAPEGLQWKDVPIVSRFYTPIDEREKMKAVNLLQKIERAYLLPLTPQIIANGFYTEEEVDYMKRTLREIEDKKIYPPKWVRAVEKRMNRAIKTHSAEGYEQMRKDALEDND